LGSNALAYKISGIVPLNGTLRQFAGEIPKEVWLPSGNRIDIIGNICWLKLDTH